MRLQIKHLKSLIKESLIFLNEGAVGASHAREILRKFKKGISKLGIKESEIESLPVLGTGTHGTAFQMPSGQVLKITNDSKEAGSSAALINKDVAGVAKIYDVWEFGDTGLYGLIAEKVYPISDSDAKEFNDALVATGLPVWIKQSYNDWSGVKKLTKAHIFRTIRKKFPDNHNSPAAQRYAHEINEQWKLLLKKYQIRKMFDTMNNLGIDFHDYHAGNLMRRENGELVIIDLGISVLRNSGNSQMRSMTEGQKKILQQLSLLG